MQGDPKDAKNMTEGGPITLAKLKTHALMRIVIWVAAACVAGASGTAIWFAKDGAKTVNRMEDRVVTGIIVQLVGASVVVVGPTWDETLSNIMFYWFKILSCFPFINEKFNTHSILQLMSLLFETAETKVVQQRRPPAAKKTKAAQQGPASSLQDPNPPISGGGRTRRPPEPNSQGNRAHERHEPDQIADDDDE
jgi:hypothetical protein